MAKRALITGITGQDGSYLAELLLEKDTRYTALPGDLSAPNSWRIDHLLERITVRPGDLLDQLSLLKVIDEVRPHEIYNLAAMSFVPASWDQPMLTGEFNRRVSPACSMRFVASTRVSASTRPRRARDARQPRCRRPS